MEEGVIPSAIALELDLNALELLVLRPKLFLGHRELFDRHPELANDREIRIRSAVYVLEPREARDAFPGPRDILAPRRDGNRPVR